MLMESWRKNNECWDVFFEEVRPWAETNTTLNWMAWITITNLPIIGWNCRCLTKILERTGQMIGFDKTTLKHFELSQLRILIGTQLDKVIKMIVLQLNNQTYQVKIEEMEHLHYPIVGSISYTVDDFQTSLEQGDGDDEEDSVDVADDADIYKDKTYVSPSVTRTLEGGNNGLEKLDLAKDGDKLSPFDDNSLVIFNALHLDVVQDQHAALSSKRFPEITAYTLSNSDSSYIKCSTIPNALTLYMGRGTPILREDVRSLAAALGLDSFLLA